MSVEGGQWLVEQQYGRIGRECPRQGDALALAAGELARLRVRDPRKAEALEQRDSAFAAELHVLAHAQVREERVVLEDQADRPLLRRQVDASRRVEPVVPVHRDPSAGELQPGDRPQERGLPGSGGPDERHDLAADGQLDVEGELAERNVESETERVHPGMSLRASRSTAPKQTKSAPIASAVSRLTSNWA